MKDTQNVTIVMLCVLAAIMATVLVLTYDSNQALADTSIRGGDYIMVTGNWSKSLDLVYIIDIAQQKINVYAVDENNNVIKMIDQQRLDRVFKNR